MSVCPSVGKAFDFRPTRSRLMPCLVIVLICPKICSCVYFILCISRKAALADRKKNSYDDYDVDNDELGRQSEVGRSSRKE